MTKFSGALFATLIAAFAIVMGASAAQAYPAPGVTVSVNHTTVVSGHSVVVNARSTVACQWTATFADQTRTDNGKHFHATFTAPQVEKKTTYPLVVTCKSQTGTTTRTTQITVLAPGTAAGPAATNNGAGAGALPNTGGPSALLLGGAAALIAAGAGTVLFTRRRHATTA